MTEAAALRETILPRMPELSPALREAADYVMNNSESVAMQSLRRIAKESSVAAATFSRLAKSLELESYEALRDLCRSDVRQRTRRFADKARTLQSHSDNDGGSFLQRHASASIANIGQTIASIDEAQLSAIVDELCAARCVVAFGALSSGPLIDHAIYSARLALPNWRSAVSGAESMTMTLEDIDAKDVVLALSQSPYAQSGLTLAQGARERGASVIAISDSYTAPAVDVAKQVLVVPTDSPHFFASQVATVLLFETLLSMVVQRAGQDAQRRIAAIENENHRSGEYWQGSKSPASN